MLSDNANIQKNKKLITKRKIVIGLVFIIFIYMVYVVIYFGILPKINKDKLIREWVGFGYTYTFTPDGKFTGEWCDDSDKADTSALRCGGTYSITGNTLTLYISMLNIDLFPSDTDGSEGSVGFFKQWIADGNYDIRWKYTIKFSGVMLYMDGLNVYDSPRLVRKTG